RHFPGDFRRRRGGTRARDPRPAHPLGPGCRRDAPVADVGRDPATQAAGQASLLAPRADAAAQVAMPQAADLWQRRISAALWGASGSGVQLVLQLGIQVALARLLGPEQYGVFAMAVIVVSFGGFFTFGLASGLIQKHTVTDEDLRFVNFWQLAVGTAVAIALFLFAETAAGFFQEPRVAPVIQAMSIVCLVQAAANTSGGLLSRDLDFKSIQLAGLAIQYWRRTHLLGLAIRHRDAYALCSYGATVCATHLNNWALMNLSRVVI